MKCLCGDIGGTKVLLASVTWTNETCEIEDLQKFESAKYSSLEEIIQEYTKGKSKTFERAAFGVAGSVRGKICVTTNLPWVLDSDLISSTFKIPDVYIINDLVANAYGIEMMKDNDLLLIKEGIQRPRENRALISAGTGLGISILFFDGKRYVATASEGGHADFPPGSRRELRLWEYLEQIHGHVSIERILSGKGLEYLYRFLVEVEKMPALPIATEMMEHEDPAVVITRLGLSSECATCLEALQWFCRLYGAAAGNLALTSCSLGGLYLGGGIAPKILPMMKQHHFLDGFKRKGRFEELVSEMPVYVILDDHAALKGAAYYAKHPRSF